EAEGVSHAVGNAAGGVLGRITRGDRVCRAFRAARAAHDGAPRAADSPVRAIDPPPERTLVCELVGALALAPPGSEGELLAELHDWVVVATWAIDVAVDSVDPDHAAHGRDLWSGALPEQGDRIVRFAATRPVASIAVARMASLLGTLTAPERRARVEAWL